MPLMEAGNVLVAHPEKFHSPPNICPPPQLLSLRILKSARHKAGGSIFGGGVSGLYNVMSAGVGFTVATSWDWFP